MGRSSCLAISIETLEGLARAARVSSDFGGGFNLFDISRAMDAMSLMRFNQPDLSGVKERDLKRVSMSHSPGLKEQTRRRVPSMAQRVAACHYRRG